MEQLKKGKTKKVSYFKKTNDFVLLMCKVFGLSKFIRLLD